MLESQTELPAQGEQAITFWARGRQLAAAVADWMKDWAQDLPGSQTVESVRGVGALVGGLKDRLPARAAVNSLFEPLRPGEGQTVLSRYALHLVVVLLAVAVVSVTQVNLPQVDLRLLPSPTPAPELGGHTVAEKPTHRGGNRFVNNTAAFLQVPVAHTIMAERDRMEVVTYTVQPNDNVWAIAQGFGLAARTVLWANPSVEKSPDLLRVGQALIIPPVDGVYYTVQPGDTVEKLAKKYKTTVEKIVSFEFNQLEEPYQLQPGQQIMLPDGSKPVPVLNYYPMTRVGSAPAGAPKGTGRFAWPTRGVLTQRYWAGHPAIDIANRTGTPILAADAGYVVMAGRDTWGYGNQVVIDHGNGFKTRYAHLHTILVKAGMKVQKNQQIGTMGSTGRSTGPHLHFEIIYNGVRRNPQAFLP